MKAIVSNSLTVAEKERPGDVAVLLKSVNYAFPSANKRPPGHAFFAEQYEEIEVSPSVHLWDRQWTRAFIDHLLRHSASTVSVPITKRLPKEAITRFWPNARIQWNTAHIPNSDAWRRGSVLDLFLRDPYGSLFQFLAHELVLDITANRVATRPDLVDDATRARFPLRAVEGHFLSSAHSYGKALATDTTVAIGALSYLLDGINYKAHAIEKLRSHFGAKAGAGIDVGGAFGALSLELRMGGYQSFDVADIKPQNAGIFLYMMEQARLASGSKFYLGKGEDLGFERSYDLISILGTMLYFARERVPEFLDKAWEALRPGGVFIIHENIRKPDWRQQEFMFTVPELEGYLSRYGDIVRYDVFSDRMMTEKEAGDLPLFRALVKKR
jgi:SAM-dependent methyltransferase